ncbi:MAG: hypothetical protein A2355_09885 [Spirochaetes bacterium RIFOXYB1_FULL_32_8]|nr:MAG: hypothetical protein A2355_09885 [Spirochaetes bacterium RIFOXYB1_FULL_32_8]
MFDLKYFRNINNISQDKLAQLLSIDKGSIASYEAGKCYPGFKNLIQLIEIFKVSLDFLLLGNDCIYPKNLMFLNYARRLDSLLHSEARNNIENSARSLLGKNIDFNPSLKHDTIDIELINSFNPNLKDIRILRNLTQPTLSKSINISRSLLAQYELKSFPSVDNITKLSESLDISMHALVTGIKLNFQFTDGYFGKTMLLADHFLSLEDHKVLIRLMESALNNKT